MKTYAGQNIQPPDQENSSASTPEFDPFFQGSGDGSGLGGWYSSSAGLIPLDAADGGPAENNDDFSKSKTLQIGDDGSGHGGNANFTQPAPLARKAKHSPVPSPPAGSSPAPTATSSKPSQVDRGGWVYYDPSGEKDLSGIDGAFSTPRPLQLGDKGTQQSGRKGFTLGGNEDWLRLPEAPHGTFVKVPPGVLGANKGNDNNYSLDNTAPPGISMDMTTRNVSPPGSARDTARKQASLGQPGKNEAGQLPPATNGGSDAFTTSNDFNNPLDFTIKRGQPGGGSGTGSTLQTPNPPDISLSMGTGSQNPPGLAKYILNTQANTQPPPAQSPPEKRAALPPRKTRGKALPRKSAAPLPPNPFNGPADFNISNGNDPRQNWNRDIVGTVFGGSSEKPGHVENEGYPPYPAITDSTYGVSLPSGDLKGKYVEIINMKNGFRTTVPAAVLDKGPHYDGTQKLGSDPYYLTNSRPYAETEPKIDKKGGKIIYKDKKPVLKWQNRSGLDLMPAVADTLHMPWKKGYIDSKGKKKEGSGDGVFSWRFVPAPPKHGI